MLESRASVTGWKFRQQKQMGPCLLGNLCLVSSYYVPDTVHWEYNEEWRPGRQGESQIFPRSAEVYKEDNTGARGRALSPWWRPSFLICEIGVVVGLP